MSSQNIPPQLQLSIPPTSFKRSFEQFGFDLESPSAVPHSHDPIDGTSTTSASSSSTRGQEGDENRRKRARSASSLSDPEDRSSDASSSTLSSFSASTSADSDSLSHSSSSQTAARRHLLLDLGLGRGLGSSVALGLGMAAAELQLGSSEPPPRIPTPELLDNEDVDMPDIDLSGFSPPVQHEEEPASPAEHVRRSVDRFNAFERHISVLRSSSPPVIPLPSSLTSRQASLSPPTLPPLPLVELGLDPQDGESEDEHEHIPSTVTTNTTASTPPRLDLNFPPTTSLSSPGPSSSRVATAESATQFRERLDSAIDGLGGGDLNFEAPSLLPIDRPEPELDRHFQRLRESLATSSTASNASGSSSASASAPRTRPSVESPLFEWAPTTLDWNITLNPTRASGSEAGQVPSLSPWRAHFRPPGAAAVADTAPDRSRYSPPYQPPRLYPRPASLAAPLSVPATTSSLDGLDVDLVDAYLDSVRVNSTNTRAWESALDRARTMRVQRERERQEEREREREREQTRERLRERERAREREREEESERERDHPWSLDSIWETGGAESLSSARPRPWESLTLRTRREMEDESEVELELARRRALQRQMHQTLDRDRDRQRDEQHERGQSSLSRAARYLESGLVDPRETPASSSTVPPRERRLRPPSDTSNPFPVSWSSRRATRPTEDGPSRPPRLHRSRSSSQTREGVSPIDWLGQMEERDDGRTQLDLFDEWLSSEHLTPRSITPGPGASSSSAAPYVEREGLGFSRRNVNPRGTGASSSSTHEDREGLDFSRRVPAETSSPYLWRPSGGWQPRLALSPQPTAQPTRTATHARSQSIPSSSLASLTSIAPQPSLHRLRSRMYGPPRAAGIGSANSLVAENAAAIRRREARTELMERLNRTVYMDIDALETPDWDPVPAQWPRNPRPAVDQDEDMDFENEGPPDFSRARTPPLRRSSRPQANPFRLDDGPPDFSGARTASHRPLGLQSESEGPPLPRRVAESIDFVDRPFRRQTSPVRPSTPHALRIPTSGRSSLDFDQEPEEPPTASSSSVNPVNPVNTWRPRRSSTRSRLHHINTEISPPPSATATASVDRRHVSWEAPSRDAGMSNSYQYLSAISNTSDDDVLNALRTPPGPSPTWPQNESPFSTLFGRSVGGPSSIRPAPSSSSRGLETNRDFSSNAAESSVPSLPPPDLGGNFERSDDMLRSTISDGPRSNVAASSSSVSPTSAYRPPTPPLPHNPYTGPFRLTMQRREEHARRVARRVPEPPSIPPLSFGGDFDHNAPPPPQEQSNIRRLAARLDSHRSELSPSARFEEAERRLFGYRGPSSSHAQGPEADPRRFFPTRPTATSSTLRGDRDAEAQPQARRYSATDMHNVLARQARLEGSRLAPDLPSTSRFGDADSSSDLNHDPSSSASRAHRLISRYHREQAEAEARDTASSFISPWADLPTRRVERTSVDQLRADVDGHRRRRMATVGTRNDNEPPMQFRHRTFRDPSFHPMFGFGAMRFRRRAMGDYVRDEDFDGSYENLLTLGGLIGDAKPKATPEHILAGLESASYKDWATAESDPRCPICLDDYQPSDPVMKLGDCRHWLHKECLEQWLKGASTCPVCRKDVKGKARRHHRHHHSGPEGSHRRDGDEPDGPGGAGPSGSGSGGNGNGNGSGGDTPMNWLNFLRD